MQSSYPSSPFIWYDPVLGLEMQQNMVNNQPISTPVHNVEYQTWLETELKNKLLSNTQKVQKKPLRLVLK
jgi:hypothetical protein